MPTRPANNRLLLWLPLTLVLAGLPLAGCKTQKPEMTYLQAYDQKLYAQALTKATPIAQAANAPDRETAALVAGMSAHALGQPQQARQFLTPLKNSPNNEIAGKARTTLGLVAQSQGQNQEASLLLKSGSDKLDGNDAARAKLHAGSSMEKIGLGELARQQYKAGVSEADDPKLKSLLSERTKPVRVYVQTGAYASRASADAQAKLITRAAIRAGQPTPLVVVTTSASGGTLYSVQIGPYKDAESAKTGVAMLQRAGVKGATITSRRDR